MLQHFELIGTGLYLPAVQLSAEDVDSRAGVAAGWVREHCGVVKRHECAPPESLASMAQAAVTAALADAGVRLEQVDLLIDASTSRHQPIPFNGAHVQAVLGIGAQGIPCLDVHSTCLGFLTALHVANGLFALDTYRHILIVASEAPLRGMNWREPESAGLVGDGAAAAVLRQAAPRPTYAFAHATYSQYLTDCQVRGGAHSLPAFDYHAGNDADYRFHMDGPRLFRTAMKHLPPMTEKLLQEAGVDRSQLQVVPHQASPRGVEMIRRLLDLRLDQYHNHCAHLGNLVAASVPAVLHRCRVAGKICAGDLLLLLGTSAGYSQAALLFRV